MADAVLLKRLEELEKQYIADALEDWLDENPGDDPATSVGWKVEREMVLEEFGRCPLHPPNPPPPGTARSDLDRHHGTVLPQYRLPCGVPCGAGVLLADSPAL